MSSLINNYLAISAIGISNSRLLSKFIQIISNCGSNILDTKITAMGSEFACCLFVEGNWGVIAKIEVALSNLEKELGITTIVRRATQKNIDMNTMPYIVHMITIDKIGILQEIIKFFAQQDIDIEDITTHTYYAHNNTKMANISAVINIKENTHVATMREEFMTYCDNLNLDASLEPLRY